MHVQTVARPDCAQKGAKFAVLGCAVGTQCVRGHVFEDLAGSDASISAAAVARGPAMQQMSEAIPFMEKPKNIDSGMAGACQAADAVSNSFPRKTCNLICDNASDSADRLRGLRPPRLL